VGGQYGSMDKYVCEQGVYACVHVLGTIRALQCGVIYSVGVDNSSSHCTLLLSTSLSSTDSPFLFLSLHFSIFLRNTIQYNTTQYDYQCTLYLDPTRCSDTSLCTEFSFETSTEGTESSLQE
jgi:hypothetical protein